MKSNPQRRRLLATTVMCGAAFFLMHGGQALAQEAEVSEIVVTGSRIQRPNLVSGTPVAVVSPERLEAQGLENVADVLVTLPQFAPSFGASRTQSTFSGVADSGLNLVNLRNLGTERSLVLINARRAPSGSIEDNAVDLNMIPSANIQRIDVITGGASAIYGADAVSGVVNIITDTDFTGLEVGLSYGEALKHHDNQNPSAYIRIGKALDRGHLGATLQYDYQGLVSCADRYLCAEDFAWFPPAAPVRGAAARSGVPLGGRFFVDGAPGSYTFDNGVLTPFSVALYGYNRNAARTLAIPTERITFAADADYEVVDGVTAFMEFNYGRAKITAPFEAHPFQSSSDLVGGVLEPSIPVDNPFIPASLRNLALANGDTEITWWQRFAGLQGRGADNVRDMLRVTGGIRGEMDTLGGFGSDWNYELSYVWGRTTLNGNSRGSISTANLYSALRAEPAPGGGFRCIDPQARSIGCVPVNPFDGYDAAETAWLVRGTGIRSAYKIGNALAYISGSVFELPAGPLQVALGVESRRIEAYEDYSAEVNAGTVTGNRISDSERTKFKTDELFVETKVPLIRDAPFFHEVNVEGAYRWSDGHNVGNYRTWRYGGDWAPIDGLRLRVMKNRAVRAPTLGEVTGIGETFGQVDDPCILYGASSNATLRANCAALGIPPNYDPPLVVIQNVGGFEGGNPNLEPEVADTLTYGFVFQAGRFDWMPSMLRELTISVDRFQIEIDGLINTVGRQNIAQLCAETPAGQGALFCSQVTRGTDPSVPGANYVLTAVNDQYQNIALLEVKGVDLEVNYGFKLGDISSSLEPWGGLNINSVWTFYDKASVVPFPGSAPTELLGSAGGDTSNVSQGWIKKQGNTTLTWTVGKFRTAWTARYIGKAKSAPASLFGGEDAVVDIKSRWYSDVSVRFAATDKVEAYGGINNVFDKEPPFFPTSQSGTQALDTVPAYYDIFGRQAYIGVKARF